MRQGTIVGYSVTVQTGSNTPHITIYDGHSYASATIEWKRARKKYYISSLTTHYHTGGKSTEQWRVAANKR